MANIVFNKGLGKIAELALTKTFGILLLKTAEADGVLRDYDTLAALLAAPGNVEADFTNYSRYDLANLTVDPTDDTGDEQTVSADDVAYGSSGGALNNNVVAAIIYQNEADVDANSIPLLKMDASFTTDGNTVTIQLPNGIFGAVSAA